MTDDVAPSLRIHAVVIDCANFDPMVGFWSAALGYVEWFPEQGGFAGIRPRERDGRPPIIFQRAPEPKIVKNRVHVDLDAGDRLAEVARLVTLGAAVIGESSLGDTVWTRVADPEGNEFCVNQR